MALPSRLDNLPNVGLEAHSCGTPIVAFKVGGIPEIVKHKKTGYLANPFSLKSFIKGIYFVLENQKMLSKNSIKKVKFGHQKSFHQNIKSYLIQFNFMNYFKKKY